MSILPVPVEQFCTLCGKPRSHVDQLILGVKGGVCTACIKLCIDVINSSESEEARPTLPPFPSQRAEWLPIRAVLLCEPSIETLFGLISTHSSNFLHPFSLAEAREEHRAFRVEMEHAGAKIYDLRDALTIGCDHEGPALDRLRAWASQSVVHDYVAALTLQEVRELETEFNTMMRLLDPASLANLILLRPMLHVEPNPKALDPTSKYLTRIELSPAHNSYYTRDPMFTTGKGCVIGRLKLKSRQLENDIAEYALEQLGIKPLYRVTSPGHVEGGDFLPCGDFVLQGQGLLSDAEGVRQCLANCVYGFVEVGVVKDHRAEMEEMHLDTYFTLLNRNLCAICEDRVGIEEPRVTIYKPFGTPDYFAYQSTETVGLREYLQEKGFRILNFGKAEQKAFAPNGLLLGPGKMLGVKGSGEAFALQLASQGVDVNWIDFNALKGGYGGPHCSSQVLHRG